MLKKQANDFMAWLFFSWMIRLLSWHGVGTTNSMLEMIPFDMFNYAYIFEILLTPIFHMFSSFLF